MVTVQSNHRSVFGMNCTQCGDLLITPKWSECEDEPDIVIEYKRLITVDHVKATIQWIPGFSTLKSKATAPAAIAAAQAASASTKTRATS